MDNNYNYDNNELYAEAKAFLSPDEQLLWIGRPCQSAKPHVSPFQLIFPFFWLGFAVFWTVTATAAGGAFGLFGIPFVLVGAYLVYTMAFGQRVRLKKTVYMVTDRRAVIVAKTAHGTTCNEYYFNYLPTISISHVNGSVGTICFERYDGYYNDGWRRGYRSKPINYDLQTSFILIDNVQSVYRLISDQIADSKDRGHI